MQHINYKGVDIYVVKEGEDYPPEPFAITARLKIKKDGYSSYAVCNSLPCNTCPLAPECVSGEHLNSFLAKEIKKIAPELFI